MGVAVFNGGETRCVLEDSEFNTVKLDKKVENAVFDFDLSLAKAPHGNGAGNEAFLWQELCCALPWEAPGLQIKRC